ncbi:hypothetical protein J3T65_03140 [Staphylococcus simiae]|uniref:hypothetical protein n=1 Tax=Staphylococcus simiae TaxID=308354 RepID=UPI001A97B4BE|nr:hypothetical protein [Staphylococcus simiae]MBO1198517.1 hypothetical protein [Staphylococcus simiae]MBO1200685.1 hypothetical protein [Staphylococcus simiae]MBO1202923.1 hypothetical protein [Staphylococcus simiae]MBO1210508.1 hypothetical protein [Staphylococcus simiae]MBO1228989.1 hypothetical protein [Staphylococcus simiae]
MKKLLALSLCLLFVLAACGNKLEGTYKDKEGDSTIIVKDDKVKMTNNYMNGTIKGTVDKNKNIMTFKDEESSDEEVKMKYKLDGKKLIINKVKIGDKVEKANTEFEKQ